MTGSGKYSLKEEWKTLHSRLGANQNTELLLDNFYTVQSKQVYVLAQLLVGFNHITFVSLAEW